MASDDLRSLPRPVERGAKTVQQKTVRRQSEDQELPPQELTRQTHRRQLHSDLVVGLDAAVHPVHFADLVLRPPAWSQT